MKVTHAFGGTHIVLTRRDLDYLLKKLTIPGSSRCYIRDRVTIQVAEEEHELPAFRRFRRSNDPQQG